MTDRDEFAKAALTGLLSFGIEVWPFRRVRRAADLAYEYADAMIAARIQTIELNAATDVKVILKPGKK